MRISGCFVLVNNLLAKESTAGETRVHLMSRSEFVLRDSQLNAGEIMRMAFYGLCTYWVLREGVPLHESACSFRR